jgi:hypothetical protein
MSFMAIAMVAARPGGCDQAAAAGEILTAALALPAAHGNRSSRPCAMRRARSRRVAFR